ncbi:MAG: response regulator transcription factor [Sphingobacteriaceae bacterium]|nr:response regulator transcription factor [Sphingobacteriaceae bacterium]
MMIKVAIVDDKRLNRLNRADELSYSEKIKVVFTSQNGQEFLETMKALAQNNLPEIVLMDIDMPEKNGIDTVREAKVIYPGVEFLMLTVFDEDEKIFEAVKAGASGYLLKDESTETIINFIQQVKEFRAVPMSPSVARKALKLLCGGSSFTQQEKTAENTLTPREIEVLKGLVEGLDYKEIAEKLFVSPNTVRNQITSIYTKLHVTCKVDAVKLAIRNKMV